MRSYTFDEYFSSLHGKIQILSTLERFQCCLKKNQRLNKTTVWSGTALGSTGTAHGLGSRDDITAGID